MGGQIGRLGEFTTCRFSRGPHNLYFISKDFFFLQNCIFVDCITTNFIKNDFWFISNNAILKHSHKLESKNLNNWGGYVIYLSIKKMNIIFIYYWLNVALML